MGAPWKISIMELSRLMEIYVLLWHSQFVHLFKFIKLYGQNLFSPLCTNFTTMLERSVRTLKEISIGPNSLKGHNQFLKYASAYY